MKWLFTSFTQHLSFGKTEDRLHVRVDCFADGERSVRISPIKHGERVNVVTHTGVSGNALIELMLILNELNQVGAEINLIIAYLGYARQDRSDYGIKGSPGHFWLSLFQKIGIKSGLIVHPHNTELLDTTVFKPVWWDDFFIKAAAHADLICSPDAGSRELAIKIADALGKKYVVLQKTRLNGEPVFQSDERFDGLRVLLVDDMIASGKTIINAAKFLADHGARGVSAAATHGLFVDYAHRAFEESCLDQIFVTDSIAQRCSGNQVQVYSLASFLETILVD